jgi:hypothetical protein
MIKLHSLLRDVQSLSSILGVSEMRGTILTTSYWLHVKLGNTIENILCQKIK